MKTYCAGIDIGSTTVKLVVLDQDGNLLFGDYRRHHAHTQGTLKSLLMEARQKLGPCLLQVKITGSGAINLGKALNMEFVQEVVAVATALEKEAPQTDVAIELGGEDAKIIYFTGGLEERMNGVCAGGTGSFIDQMAALLQTDASGLNEAAKSYQRIYPIAARCGVFAKTDIQPLINDGATKADLAASIFQAVVNQTISGLACGKPIRGCVAFLGGPLHFLTELKQAFVRTLKLTEKTTVDPENSHLFAAMGAALEARDQQGVEIDSLIATLESGVQATFEMPRLEPLFRNQEEYQAFCSRHNQAVVGKQPLSEYQGDCFLGIDAGSTTTKMVVIGQDGQLLHSFYAGNQGNPILTAQFALGKLKRALPEGAKLVRGCSTGYGEDMVRSAFCFDTSLVETMAHFAAAKKFQPEVDFIIDIGGQDIKCFQIRNGVIDNIFLNEACSSGCGSFLQTFAGALGYSIADFAQRGIYADNPVDLGSRCTVFMNSSVKQAQKDGASIENISAGLSVSVVKNAIYKVIRAANGDALGKHIVVQGGTFLNDAVLRAFEQEIGRNVTRPNIAGLMGAYGAALYAKRKATGGKSTVLNVEGLAKFTHQVRNITCNGCENHCSLTINTFDGGRRFIGGNRCEKPTAKKGNAVQMSLYDYKRQLLAGYTAQPGRRGKLGIPMGLNFFELLPFFHTFFTKLGFEVIQSPVSSRSLYQLGQNTISSDTACYPAKLMHGHIQSLIDSGVETIFYPCLTYNMDEGKGTNHYNCPVVAYYPEVIRVNMPDVRKIRFLSDYLCIHDKKQFLKRITACLHPHWPDITKRELQQAAEAAYQEYSAYLDKVHRKGEEYLRLAKEKGLPVIILAGRPYHLDPEVNHGIDQLIGELGAVVISEDAIAWKEEKFPVNVLNQWTYHTRLYAAAKFVAESHDPKLNLVQMVSFGCGLDAITTDEVRSILERGGKIYTQIKIDEITNLGAVRIRLRSLFSALNVQGGGQ